MKIYILPFERTWEPRMSPYMPHSKGYNIEVAFLSYLQGSDLLTDNPQEADWHYLPIFWSHWQLANDYGRQNRDKMQELLDNVVLDENKTFTVSEADGEPNFNIGKIIVFSANRGKGKFIMVGKKGSFTPPKSAENRDVEWITAPIITLPHRVPTVLFEKKYLSSFVGSFNSHPMRIHIKDLLKDFTDIKIERSENVKNEELFVNTILESYSTLCPRGSAMSSFRFYESMQLGTVPIMIAEYDMRPFPDKIDWDSCSYFFSDIKELPMFFKTVAFKELTDKSKKAKEVWQTLFDEWPSYILDELRRRS